jgi:hypothetical protein
MNVVSVPGSDSGIEGALRLAEQAAAEAQATLDALRAQAENPALPPEAAKKPKVSITRAKGETNQHTL